MRLRTSRKQNKFSRMGFRSRSQRHDYNCLEQRRLLAFSGIFDIATSTLELNQTVDHGDTVIDNNGVGSAFRAMDTSGTYNGVAATNVIVNLLPNTGNRLQFDLHNFHGGNVELNLGDGDRAVVFSGSSNFILGNLTINGGSGDQGLEFANVNPLGVTGDATIDLSSGADNTVFLVNGSIAGELRFVGVNGIANAAHLAVGQNLIVDNTLDVLDAIFTDTSSMNISGDFVYNGGDGRDVIDFSVGTSQMIGGNLLVDFGNNTGDGQAFLNLNNSLSLVVGGNLSIRSTSQFNIDAIYLNTDVGGDVDFDLGGGENQVIFGGMVGGTSLSYMGGSGEDEVQLFLDGIAVDANVELGLGDDAFFIPHDAVNSLQVDFGGGRAFFQTNGKFVFDASFLNMNGFNNFYTVSNDLWNMVQLVDAGDVTLDNNGSANNALRFIHGGTSELSPADNVRLNLLNNSSSNVYVDFDNSFAGNVLLDLFSGDRRIEFTGDDNSIGGALRIFANDGDQYVDLAANTDLTVGDNALITLREGVDQVDDSGNNITVGNNLIMRRVNYFENDGTLAVGNNLTWNSAAESVANTFDNDGTLDVGNRLYFKSGSGLDNVLLNHGVSIGGPAFIDVGDGSGTGPQNVFLTSGFSVGARLTILGGINAQGNVLKTDAQTVVGGHFIVNFSANPFANQAMLAGSYEGNFGIYKGGSAADTVTFRAQADDMKFNLRVNEGTDTFTLDDETNLFSLYANFGADQDIDVFIDEFGGTYPFPVNLVNLP